MRLLLALLLVPLLPMAARAKPPGLTIFAAASLTDAFKDIGNLWAAAGHPLPTFSFASSSTLAQQILHGAPADIFASADEAWMDKLQSAERIVPATRGDIVGNTLVLVEPRAALKPIALQRGAKLAAVLGAGGRLAVGDPKHVPAGIYAAQALKKLGLWTALQSRLAPADSVRSALTLVTTGEAPAGIVYGTDARIAPTLGIAGTFPADSHEPIRYPVAAVARITPDVTAFLAFLRSPPAQDVFRHYGFPPP